MTKAKTPRPVYILQEGFSVLGVARSKAELLRMVDTMGSYSLWNCGVLKAAPGEVRFAKHLCLAVFVKNSRGLPK